MILYLLQHILSCLKEKLHLQFILNEIVGKNICILSLSEEKEYIYNSFKYIIFNAFTFLFIFTHLICVVVYLIVKTTSLITNVLNNLFVSFHWKK